MHRLIYGSRAVRPMDVSDLTSLLRVSRDRNEAAGLTGMLLYCDESFLQLLDGPLDALEETYARICADPRHEDLRLLMLEPAAKPLFPNWTMGFHSALQDELAADLPGFRSAISYPMIDEEMIPDASAAITTLKLVAAWSAEDTDEVPTAG